jgi:hypothetical protein
MECPMMANSWRGPARRRGGAVGVEALEGRVLLSTATLAPAPGATAAAVAAHPAAPVAPHHKPVHRPWSPGGLPDPTFHGRLKFATDTLKQGHALIYSHDVIKAGWHYTRLTISQDTGKVGLAYLKAAIRGNGKELKQLGHSQLVKKVGDNFQSLSRTNVVRHVGQTFSRFGYAVSDQFTKLFGSHPHPHPRRPRKV